MSPRLPLAAILLCALLPLGCASPGQPKSPSLHLPEIPKGITATRTADHVDISWTTPGKTTDGDPIRSKVIAVLCREIPSAPSALSPRAPQPCTPVQRVTVVPGPSTATESLPAALLKGPPNLLVYHIDLLSPAGRSAGPSAPIYAAGGQAPTPLTSPLAISGRRDGAVITWPRAADPAPMFLTRTLIQPPDAPKPAPSKPTGFPSSRAESLVVRLRPEGQPATDPGGTIDHTALPGNSYTYVGERVLTVTLAGHPLEMHGLLSPPATFTLRDTFPPSSPTGLASVPGGGFGDAPSIDLTWDPNPEYDLLGYNVYRSEAGSPFTLLNHTPLPPTAYRDLKVEPGHSYVYRVTAVDKRHNESAAGSEIHETLRK